MATATDGSSLVPDQVHDEPVGPSTVACIPDEMKEEGLLWNSKGGGEGVDDEGKAGPQPQSPPSSSLAGHQHDAATNHAHPTHAPASSVASFASLEDAEETVRIRGGAAAGVATGGAGAGAPGGSTSGVAASSSAGTGGSLPVSSRQRSVFDMFADVPNQPPPSKQNHDPAHSSQVDEAGTGSALSSIPTEPTTTTNLLPEPEQPTLVLLDGMHRVRAHSAASKSNVFSSVDCNNSIGAAYCDPVPPRATSHPHHHHHHPDPSMNDLSFLMREQDADLLESIQRKAANDDANDDEGGSGGTRGGGGGMVDNAVAVVESTGTTGAAAGGDASGSAGDDDADADGSALSTIPPSLMEARPKKPARAVSSEAANAGAASATAAPAVVSTTPKSARHRTSSGTIKPASLRTLLVRHESGDAGNVGGPAALLRRASQASGGGYADGGADDHASVGTEGTHAAVGGERARMALSGEIWVLPDDLPPPAPSSASSVAAAAAAPLSSPKRADPASLSVSAIAQDDETLLMPSFGADSTTLDAASQVSLVAEPKRGRMVRSESHDRRLNEAAQFAEAVGELQLAEQNELMIIDEEDRNSGGNYDFDDDTDDDATEIHVEGEVDRGRGGKNAAVVLQGVPVEVSVLHHPNKARPQWPFRTKRTKGGFLDKLPENGTSASQSFVYKGIRANPPEIVSRGVTRGNYSCLHRKAWLECTDKYHRYGKNLRLYYRYWERLGFPTNMFFDWLDSKGEAAGQPLPELEECPRSQLDSDTVLYITDEHETRGYAVQFVVDESGRAVVVDVDSEVVRTGPEGWIFVLRDNVMYGAQKITSVKGHCKQRFHHSSFFGGKAVAAAGIFITDDNGGLLQVLPHSGHYRPGEAHMQRMLFFLHNQGVDLWSFQVDMQQILHVARDTDGAEKVEKKKKTETLRLTPAGLVACYLAHKARFIGEGIFSQIHRIKKADVATVSEALELIDDGSTGRTSVKETDMSH